ncbi:MAG TPA: cytochrome c3 family protein [Thermoanaerobaculia bacterium]|nr:cytochrome c3 family protein [Thermoanaerobaculia bacterium]
MSGTAMDHGFIVERGGALESTGTLSGGLRRVAGDVLRIGRGTNADLRFDDPAVALEHARLERRDDGLWAIDQESVTGTYVNGQAVSEARLADGDRLEIGGHRLTVRMQPRAPVIVRVAAQVAEVEETAAPAAAVPGGPAGPAVAAHEVDYVAAYRLRRGVFGKVAVSLALLLAAAVAIAWVVADEERHVAFRPGAVAEAHGREHSAWACANCHGGGGGEEGETELAGLRGEALMNALCAGCHAAESAPHATMPAAAAVPGCVDCHAEHRGQEDLRLVDDRRCVDCHADAAVVASAIGDFEGHPEFATKGGDDPGTVEFNHERHLRELVDLGRGKVTLGCEDCHRLAENGDDLEPIVYETTCAGCHQHRLDVDVVADRDLGLVPHERWPVVDSYVVGEFVKEAQGLSEAQRATAPRGESTRLERSGRRNADRALDRIRDICRTCHELETETGEDGEETLVVPAANVPSDWMPTSHFSHRTHLEEGKTCGDCHVEVKASTRSADVLLPGVTSCVECHGETAAGVERRQLSGCDDCHSFHPNVRAKRSAVR